MIKYAAVLATELVLLLCASREFVGGWGHRLQNSEREVKERRTSICPLTLGIWENTISLQANIPFYNTCFVFRCQVILLLSEKSTHTLIHSFYWPHFFLSKKGKGQHVILPDEDIFCIKMSISWSNQINMQTRLQT